jgi:hypothetical protein
MEMFESKKIYLNDKWSLIILKDNKIALNRNDNNFKEIEIMDYLGYGNYENVIELLEDGFKVIQTKTKFTNKGE